MILQTKKETEYLFNEYLKVLRNFLSESIDYGIDELLDTYRNMFNLVDHSEINKYLRMIIATNLDFRSKEWQDKKYTEILNKKMEKFE